MEAWVVPVFVAFFVGQHAVETGLLLLELRHVKRSRGVPPALAARIAADAAERSRSYTLANGRFGLVQGLLGAAATLAVVLSGALPWLDRALAARGLAGANLFVAFLGILTLAGAAASLPFAAYHTFAVEARWGFNRTTPRLWATDRLRALAVEAALGIPLLYAAYGFMRFAGRLWWIWLFAFLAGVQLFMTWLYPAVIAPFFNRFVPLPDGPLRARLESLARDAGFRNRGLYVMDASRRSSHSNAYFTGLWRPRIVLFDTLVDRMSPDEAAGVLAHEIGHFLARHVHRRLAVSLAAMLAGLFVLSRLVAWPAFYAAFGFEGTPLHGALALLALGGGAFVFWLQPLAARISRRHEYEADRYAVRLARAPAALVDALVRLHGENLSNLHPHPWFSAWHYGHPVLVERIAAIEREAAAARSG